MEERETFTMENAALDMLDCITKKAEKANPKEDGDYIGADGLLYCGRCHTPRQMNYRGRTNMVLCDCRMAEQEARRAKEEKEKRDAQIEALRRNCFPESAMYDWTFDSDDGKNPRYINGAKAYVEHFVSSKKEDRKGLLLCGEPGTGKTYLAACIANALIDRGYRVHMTNFSRIVNLIQNRFEGRQEYIDSLNRYSLLILDDLGIERKTGYMQENIYTIIDNRYRLNLPTIITTNLTKQDFATEDIDLRRIYDRILERCLPVEVVGINRRLANFKNDMADFRRRIGM